MADYAELHCHSNFSFLDGASHPIELALQARELGLRSLAITDTGGVYGAVRFVDACKKADIHPVIGTCLEVDGRELVLLARTRAGYSNLCRLLSQAHRNQPNPGSPRNRGGGGRISWGGKGEARTTLGTLEQHGEDLFCLAASDDAEWLGSVRDALGRDQVFVELHNHRRQEDLWVLEGRVELAAQLGLETIATNHVRYHHRARRPLHDVLTAIRHRATLEEVRDRLPSNSEQVLKGPDERWPRSSKSIPTRWPARRNWPTAARSTSTSATCASPTFRCRTASRPSTTSGVSPIGASSGGTGSGRRGDGPPEPRDAGDPEDQPGRVLPHQLGPGGVRPPQSGALPGPGLGGQLAGRPTCSASPGSTRSRTSCCSTASCTRA